MTTSISSKAFGKKQKAKELMIIQKKNRKHFKNHESLKGFVINILIAFLIFYIFAFCSLTGRPTEKIFTE